MAFSPVTIDGADEGWFGIGPVSVAPERQGDGIGSALILKVSSGFAPRARLDAWFWAIPPYYPRFGFERSDDLRYDGAPADHFMSLTFDGLAWPGGKVEYHPAFAG